ncbi:MAG TPA: ribonuclease HII [Rectinemataceae bacterium]|nr:ribonuclease HII [Rectinemataceae bacterium]
MNRELFETPRVLRAEDFPSLPPRGSGVCGIDEAGRGPLAGPVFAAAVVLPEDFPLDILGDSKALSPARRASAFPIILGRALAWAIEWASSAEIDELNILGASLLAMRRAYLALGYEADRVYVDGNRFPDLGRPCWPVIKGDAILPAVMAASILAKVARDRAMERFDWLYPEYGYARHKGYPTAEHRALCRRLGPSPIQRLSFRYDR